MSPDPFELDNSYGVDDSPMEEPKPSPVASTPAWLEGLNSEQQQAVETVNGAVLVLSGAGTGKTRVLTTRLAYLMYAGFASPFECLAVTFTNRAAREMKERVASMIGPVAESMWLGTFHSLGVRILRKHAQLLDLQSNYTILDTDDQNRLVKQLMEEDGIDIKKWNPKAAVAIIQRWKDKGLTPDKIRNSDNDFAEGRSVALYKKYQAKLLQLNAVDFGDLLLHPLTLFTKHLDVLAEYQNRFRYVMVDEYQDTNIVQYLLIRLLVQKHKNLCCVGDDDQCIYTWRGAEVDNILRFEKDFPGAKTIRLERNYRSTEHILAVASGLIDHNRDRMGKTLRAASGSKQEAYKVAVRGVWDGQEEARNVIDEVEALHRKGNPLSEIAILVRASFQMREFEERLITTGTPYRVIGGPRFYERMEIRDALAYLRLILQKADSLAFERIINKPKRGLGKVALQTIHQTARAMNCSLFEASENLIGTDEMTKKARGALGKFVESINKWRRLLDEIPHVEVVSTVLEESGYMEMWKRDKSPDSPGRIENLKEFVGGIGNSIERGQYANLQEFLEHVALVMENEESVNKDQVSLMTLHGAKGLEFDAVFLPGWEEGVLPHQRSMMETGDKGVEEERRLAHVGVTRARKRAFISFARNRSMYGHWQSNPISRFVEELPKEHIEVSNNGIYGEMPRSAGRSYSAGGEYGNSSYSSRNYSQSNNDVSFGSSKPAAITDNGFRVGLRVFHNKFGYGLVSRVEGDKLEIAFEKTGIKKVMKNFVTAA
ncbi:MAG: UvrD-helicase domain-containing protein [Alphaproteobacteria bacterium]|nr:UvrD-helicase domain-containing protein [Alphaproteobacteria bacterium]